MGRCFYLFLVIFCLSNPSISQAKHSFTITFDDYPEYHLRLKQTFATNSYKFSAPSKAGPYAQVIVTSTTDASAPSPDFLIDLFLHTFVRKIQPTAFDNQQLSVRLRIHEKLNREELATFMDDLQSAGAWIQFVRIIPAFNLIMNFARENEKKILATLAKYEFIDHYEVQSSSKGKANEERFLNDTKRRGITRIELSMARPNMIPMIMDLIPKSILEICVVDTHLGSEQELITFACPNEFEIVQGILNAVAKQTMSQAVYAEVIGDYNEYLIRRQQAYMIETKPYKRLVLEPRLDRIFEVGEASKEYEDFVGQNKEKAENDLAAYNIGSDLLRQSVTASGYSIFKLQPRQLSPNLAVQQIFVELPEAGISKNQLDQLFVDFRVFPYLDNGQMDVRSELTSSELKECEAYLSKK